MKDNLHWDMYIALLKIDEHDAYVLPITKLCQAFSTKQEEMPLSSCQEDDSPCEMVYMS